MIFFSLFYLQYIFKLNKVALVASHHRNWCIDVLLRACFVNHNLNHTACPQMTVRIIIIIIMTTVLQVSIIKGKGFAKLLSVEKFLPRNAYQNRWALGLKMNVACWHSQRILNMLMVSKWLQCELSQCFIFACLHLLIVANGYVISMYQLILQGTCLSVPEMRYSTEKLHSGAIEEKWSPESVGFIVWSPWRGSLVQIPPFSF